MNRLFLIDGHALIFRSYYALLRRPLVNSKGLDTSILFGFTKSLLELINRMQPTHIAVAFDPPAKTFRHELYPEYKANRMATPELIKSSLEPLKEIINALSIPILMRDGYEADDIIGSMAKRAEKEDFKVYMVTPDKDFGQLISDNIYQVKPGSGVREEEIVSKEDICKKYSITSPSQVIDILTIWGDASDNVPGVRGIGEVSSKKLINEFGSVENIYANIEKLSPKQREAFEEARHRIELSKRLVTIETSVEVTFDTKTLVISQPNYAKLKQLFENYEFTSLLKLLPREADSIDTFCNSKNDRETVRSKIVPVTELLLEIERKREMTIEFKRERFYISAGGIEISIVSPEYKNLALLEKFLENEGIAKCGFQIKECINRLRKIGLMVRGELYDIEIMHYLIMPESSHKIETLSASYLNISFSASNITNEGEEKTLFDCIDERDDEETDESASLQTTILIRLRDVLRRELESLDLWKLYRSIEMPLIYVLSDMEFEGIKIDSDMLRRYGEELNLELSKIESEIRSLADDPHLNVASPKQLGVILFEKLKIRGEAKKGSKQSLSTNEETLIELYDRHPIVPKILEFRNLKKLLSTYIEPLPNLADKLSGKIHTTYKQALTATGRLSSIRPNIQNIPIRTERGREIRRAFISSHENGEILSSDYSQIELRLMAHLSGDPDFIQAFKEKQDIHTSTAAKIFHIKQEDVSKEQRNRAKVANFGIIYGISSFGLSQRLGLSRKESKELISEYFDHFPLVKRYMNNTVEFAKREGYVQTIYGRKRFLPEINSKNAFVRGVVERNAINAPLQGSAADIIKMAMVRIFERLRSEGLKSKMVLQVHDELVFDVVDGELERLKRVVTEVMEHVIELSVPLTVECTEGKNWLEAH